MENQEPTITGVPMEQPLNELSQRENKKWAIEQAIRTRKDTMESDSAFLTAAEAIEAAKKIYNFITNNETK